MFQHPNSAAHPTFSSRLSQRRSLSLISLTPLIDVVFILLLFFMLASNFLQLNTIVLDAPTTGATAVESSQGALLVEIRLDGIRLSAQYVSLQELSARVSEYLQKKPDLAVLVQPGAGVNLQRTVYVLDRLSAAGATHLSLMQSPGSHALE